MPAENITENIRTLRNGVRITLLRSTEIPPPEEFLSETELKKCAGFRIEKRRLEWLGGRYAAKTLLREILQLQPPLREIEITYDGFGRPVWSGARGRHLISITHSGPFCAAAAKTEPCVFLGIDLEKAEPRAKPWYEDYFHKDELAGEHDSETAGQQESKKAGQQDSEAVPSAFSLQPSALFHMATSLWTQKEALLKALGLGLKADPLDIKTGKKIQFSNTALKRYQELGSPEYLLETIKIETGYYLSAVADV